MMPPTAAAAHVQNAKALKTVKAKAQEQKKAAPAPAPAATLKTTSGWVF